MRQPGKEHPRPLAELLRHGGQALRAFLAAQQRIGVARQLFKANVADRKAEVTRSDFFQLMRLVEDHRRGLGQNARVGRAGGLAA